MRAPIFIDEATVAEALAYPELVSVIGRAFLEELSAPPRCVAETREPDGRTRTLLAMPAMRPGGLAVTKLVTIFSGAGVELHSQILVQNSAAEIIAIIAGHELTARRTAAASVLAARTLGAHEATSLAVLGAGRQARALLSAYLECLPVADVRIWARRKEAGEELAAIAREHSIVAKVPLTAAEAVGGADIVTCATGSRVPLFAGSDIASGAHVDLVGGFRPTMREADDSLMARALVVADTPTALSEAGDLTQPIASGALRAGDVRLLADVLRAPRQNQERSDVTLFKSVGYAAEDLVAVELLLERLGIPMGANE